jgi:lysophospholipase L1-like esterase
MHVNFARRPVEARPRAEALVHALLLMIVSIVALWPSPTQAAAVRPLRILPLGDSITYGQAYPNLGGYRVDLEDYLLAEDYDFTFVGSQQNGPTELESRQHEGHRGYRIDEIASSVQSWLTTSAPDYVLLMIGTNDILQDYQLQTAPNRLSSLIGQITAARPNTQVLVSSLIPLTDPELDAKVQTYNEAIPGIVQNYQDQGKKVSFVDMYPVVGPGDLPDGIHPNETGYDNMAVAWHGALQQVLPAPPAPTQYSCPCTIWPNSRIPKTKAVTTTTGRELGVKFRTEVSGTITGIRFYKGPGNTGTHVGHLWTRTGTLLGTVTFSNETNTGWQQATFSSPIPVQADTTYIASYYAPAGHWAYAASYFAKNMEADYPLEALAWGMSGPNGVFKAEPSGFPIKGGKANFWVDVLFQP